MAGWFPYSLPETLTVRIYRVDPCAPPAHTSFRFRLGYGEVHFAPPVLLVASLSAASTPAFAAGTSIPTTSRVHYKLAMAKQ